jgi:hypothetical protein
VSYYDFSTSILINILPLYFTFFMNVLIYGHLMFFFNNIYVALLLLQPMLNICKAHFEYFIFWIPYILHIGFCILENLATYILG